jgi:hypothetical protein
MDEWRDRVRRYSGWLLLLAGGLLLPLITDLAASWLEKTFGQTPAQLIQLLAILGGIALVLWVVAVLLRRREEEVVLVPRDARPPRSPGLIALVGPGPQDKEVAPQEQPSAKAIEYHLGAGGALKACWLIASGGKEGSVLVAEAIRDLYHPHRCQVKVCPIGDPFSVQDTYDVVQRIYNHEIYGDELKDARLKPDDVISDFTGGTKPMTAGMVLACGRHRPMQYTTGHKPGIASMPKLVDFKPTPRRRAT